jgi:hypothetical protein
MKKQKIIFVAALLTASLSAAQAQFTAGDLVVLQEGTGSAALTSTGTAVFLDQYSTSGTFVNNFSIPSSGSTALVNSGTATSEGALTLSANGQYLVLAGYNVAAGTTGVAGGAAPRALGTVDAIGNYSLATTTTSFFSANNIRSGTTDGSGNFWAAGANSGVVYMGTGTPSAVSTTSANNRVIQDIGGNLYFSTGSGTRGIYSISGTPTATGNTATLMIATGSSSSPYDFAFNSGMTTAYVADSALGIQRYDFSAGSWALSYTLDSGVGVDGLAVNFSGANPVIYATTATGATLIGITDTGAGSTATTLATAAVNTAFRGLDFVPQAVPEPTTLALAGLGGVACMVAFRRKS